MAESGRGRDATPDEPADVGSVARRTKAPRSPEDIRVKVLLTAQDGPLPRDPIGEMLAAPPRRQASPDEVTWIRSLLPAPQTRPGLAERLAAHLDLLPHLAFDDELSLPIAYLSGHLCRRGLAGSALGERVAWSGKTDADFKSTVSEWVSARCLERALSTMSPTHKERLRDSLPVARLKLGRRTGRRAVGDDGSSMDIDESGSLADNDPSAHRRRINVRQDALVALLDMICDRVGGTSPMVSDRVLARCRGRAQAFILGPGTTPAPVNPDLPTRPQDGGGTSRRRRPTLVEAAEASRAELHRWRAAQVESMRATWACKRRSLVARHMRLGLPGALCDATRGGPDDDRLPFTPRDGALVIAEIVRGAAKGLTCGIFGAFDATRRGFPHLHCVVVMRREEWAPFLLRVGAYYRKFGVPLQELPPRWRRYVVFHRLLRKVADQGWTYPLRKLEPPTREALLGSDHGTPDPALRRAAWRQAHRIPRAPSVGLKPTAAAKALLRVERGASRTIDEATNPVPGALRQGPALRATGGAMRHHEPSYAPRTPARIATRAGPRRTERTLRLHVDPTTLRPTPGNADTRDGAQVTVPGRSEPYTVVGELGDGRLVVERTVTVTKPGRATAVEVDGEPVPLAGAARSESKDEPDA